ncbi:hypothetical protein BDW74DRAFT_179289 [Aspergillus multicolor]|uniref:uncharacterized protein n=1 Tax=Aspergillus multicolor TaxID=41759 RepID=UPI003CCDDF4C
MGGQTEFGRAGTVYNQSVSNSSTSIRVLNIPKIIENQAEFECPFCHQTLLSESMKIRSEWKRHVFSDLKAYVCTFANFQNAEKLYATRDEWIYHEMQMHRREWKCPEGCGQVHYTRSAMEDHLTHRCQNSPTEAQSQVLLDLSERPIDDAEFGRCPLCATKPMSIRRLRGHLAQHMEELSLFVLSRTQEGHDGAGNDVQSLAFKRVARPISVGTQPSSSESQSSSLDSPMEDESRLSHFGKADVDTGNAEPHTHVHELTDQAHFFMMALSVTPIIVIYVPTLVNAFWRVILCAAVGPSMP